MITGSLGILGGGQLGRLIALAARRFGLRIAVLDPDADAPCAQVADQHVIAAYDDLPAIFAFAAGCDLVTFEFENIPQSTVAALEAQGHRVAPSSQVLSITQDRVFEKQFIRDCGLKTAPFAAISTEADFEIAVAEVGFPAILKTRRGGYDGKGQWGIQDREALSVAFQEAQLQGRGGAVRLILEGFVPFERELSIIAARGWDGECVSFPVVENEHHNGILARSFVPACVEPAIVEMLGVVAQKIGTGLSFVGTFAVETFLVQGEILVNEIAPRVHNSGHYTLEATSISQFEAHLRAIFAFPLTTPRLLSPAVMLNLLGTDEGNRLAGVEELLAIPETTLHLYGKHEAKAWRKMGHVTILGTTIDEVLQRSERASTLLHWVP